MHQFVKLSTILNLHLVPLIPIMPDKTRKGNGKASPELKVSLSSNLSTSSIIPLTAAPVSSTPTLLLESFLTAVMSSVQQRTSAALQPTGKSLSTLPESTMVRNGCQQVAAGSPIPWAELNPSLMAATVLGSVGLGDPGKICNYCNLCLALDHNICRRFNRGMCTISPCKLDHLYIMFAVFVQKEERTSLARYAH